MNLPVTKKNASDTQCVRHASIIIIHMQTNCDLETQCQAWVDPVTGDSLTLQSGTLDISNEIDKVRSTRYYYH